MTEIFLFEDSAPLSRILTHALRDAGYNVSAFPNGQVTYDADALAMADLIITDLEMPEVDGETAIFNVREVSPNTPIIGISGMRSDRLQSTRLSEILQKPFEPNDLVKIVNRMLAS